ncbi:MAG: hypothetical protein ACFFAY_11530 [Promethearchaeota archaeon]
MWSNFDKRTTRRAFREIIRMIQIDEDLLNKLASFIKRGSGPDLYDLAVANLDTESATHGLDQIPAWNYLLNRPEMLINGVKEGAKFAAEIAFEFKHRRGTRWKFRKWTTYEISEYVTRKILRQQRASKEPWCKKKFLEHIFLGLGPWSVLDDVDRRLEEMEQTKLDFTVFREYELMKLST